MDYSTHISVKDLNVWYGKNKALNNITIEIPDKKITAIIGPSGCGKTTLLRTFNRLIDIQDSVRVNGQILVDDEDIYNPKVEVNLLRKKMGLLSQRTQVLPMSIYDNVSYGPRIHGVKGEEILKQIERMEHSCPFNEFYSALSGLKKGKEMDVLVECYLRTAGLWDEVKDRLHSPASKLSIGQQQRLCLARGLAVEPEIILGDEPTSALDPVSAEFIEQRFLKLKDRYTIILVTHILRQAKRLADYVVFLYLGNLIEHGPAEEIFKNPKNPKTKNYIDGNFIESKRE